LERNKKQRLNWQRGDGIETDQSTDWSPGMRVKTEVGYTAQSYCRGGSGNGTGYLIQHSRPTGHIMRDQQIIREANATEDGNKCQRRRGQLRQQTKLMGGTNMRERVNQVWKGCVSGRVGSCGTGRKSVGSRNEEGMCVGLGDAELVGCCGRGRKGVRSGTEAGIWVGSEDLEWIRRSGKWNRSGE